MKDVLSLVRSMALLVACSCLFVGVNGAGQAPRPVALDERLSVVHVGGQYPDRSSQQDFLNFGASTTQDLGFSSIEIFLDQRICRSARTQPVIEPYGLYQTLKYCEATDPGNPESPLRLKAGSLLELAMEEDFKQVLDRPFGKFILTTDGIGAGSAEALDTGSTTPDGKPGKPIAQSKLDSLTQEYYNFAKYLYSRYRTENKMFVLLSGSELDWFLVAWSKCKLDTSQPDACVSVQPDPVAVENMKAYLNAVSDGIHKARDEEANNSLAKIYHGCEVNMVIRKDPGVGSMTTDVLPHARCDLIGYSAHEAWRATTLKNPQLIVNALDRIAKHAPRHPDFPHRNVFISEVGFKENAGDDLELFVKYLRQILDWGVPYLQLWELYDNTCDEFSPGPDGRGCKGFWLIKPDGNLGALYPMLQKLDQVPAIFGKKLDLAQARLQQAQAALDSFDVRAVVRERVATDPKILDLEARIKALQERIAANADAEEEKRALELRRMERTKRVDAIRSQTQAEKAHLADLKERAAEQVKRFEDLLIGI